MVDEKRCATNSLKNYLGARPKGRVIVETCSEAFGVADIAMTAGHEVRVSGGKDVSLRLDARLTRGELPTDLHCRLGPAP